MNKIKLFFALIILFGLCGFIYNTHSFCATGELYVGAAKVDITPQFPIRMSGYGGRTEPSQGIHDPLYIKVLVLDVSGYRVGIISCDLSGYRDRGILDIARERFNIPHLLICSSHTHSGPNLRESASYARSVEKAMIDGLNEALNNMFPARISAGYGKGLPAVGYMRNIIGEDGHARLLHANSERIPYRTVDPEVGVIKIEDENRNPRVILMTYACHAVANHINYDISADYPGAATRKVEEAFGNNTICMFVQGGAGDINPLFYSPDREGPDDEVQTDYSQIEKIGAILSNGVIKVVKSLSPKITEKTTLKAMCDSLKFVGRFDKERSYNVHITTVLINDDIGIATFPGEPFVRHQLFWKEYVEIPNPFFFGYTFSSGGRSPGYVPDIRTVGYGGHGIDSGIQIGAGEAIMNKHLENLYRLRGIIRDEPWSK